MKSIYQLLSFTFLAALAACGAVPLSEGGAKVQLMKSDPVAACKEVGSVRGQADGVSNSATLERAKTDMRNKAATMGANYVRMESAQASTGEIMGTAFDCPQSPGSSAPPGSH